MGMFGFSDKRFLVAVGLSVGIWYASVIVQGLIGYNAPFNLLATASTCKLTGFPVATFKYDNSYLAIDLVNLVFWFLVVHLFISFILMRKSK